jgi:thioredoxin reductase
MAVDTPARIAVLGAGPIGLEAALYGRFLGYQVQIYEQGEVADDIRRWGHVVMFSPFAMNSSPLGLAALAAQDAGYRAPLADQLLTGRDYVERYLLPLAQTDLLQECVQTQTRVLSVGRRGLLKDQPIGSGARQGAAFELIVADPAGQRRAAADVVIDATGTYRTPRWLGSGGVPAINETKCQARIRYHLPDILGCDRDQYAARHTLVVGSGHSAATAVVALSALADRNPATEIVWSTRRPHLPPLAPMPDDPLPARARLAETANRLASSRTGHVRFLPGREVRGVKFTDAGGLEVESEVDGQAAEVLQVDQLLALVGYRPDWEMVNELQVHRCYATEGPMNLAASLLAHASTDCLSQPPSSAQLLVTTEPGYFVVGSKSYGRNPNFLIATGLSQIQQIFTILADRRDLNLYANMQHLLP